MKAARFGARLATLALVVTSAAHARGPKDVTTFSGPGPALQLADGSSIQLPCDKAFASGRCRLGDAIQDASQSASLRPSPLKRRAQVFDAQTPGVVASVRG